MTQSNFRDILIEGDSQSIRAHVDSSENELRENLSDLLYIASMLKWDFSANAHPIITLNAIKNLIGDDRKNPSKSLLLFGARLVSGKELRAEDLAILEKERKEGFASSVFISDLQNALCDGNKSVHVLSAQLFLASDRSLSLLEVVSEVLLHNIPQFALFVFHTMRAFSFQGNKDNLWAYLSCMIHQAKGIEFRERINTEHVKISDYTFSILKNNQVRLWDQFSIMLRFWEGDFVRIKQFRTDISYYLKRNNFETENEITPITNHWICNGPKQWGRHFIELSEKILEMDLSVKEKSEKIISLESLRAIGKKCDPQMLPLLGGGIEALC